MGGHAEGGDGDDGGHGDGHDNLYGWHGHGYVVQVISTPQTLIQFCFNVVDAAPTLKQHWFVFAGKFMGIQNICREFELLFHFLKHNLRPPPLLERNTTAPVLHSSRAI